MATYIYATVSFIVLLQCCMPFNKERAFLVILCLIAFIWAITTTFATQLFSLYTLTTQMYIRTVIMLALVIPMMIFMRVEIEAVINTGKEFKKSLTGISNKLKNIFKRNKAE